MHVVSVLHGFPPEVSGGSERAVEALARGMQRQGCTVTVVAGSLRLGDPSRPTRHDLDGLPVIRLHRDDLDFEDWFKTYSPAVSMAFRELLAELQPDVVHVHHWLRLSCDLARSARAAGCRVAVTCHDYFTVLARPVRRVGDAHIEPPPAPPWLSARERDEALALHRREFADELRAAHLRFAPSRAQAEGVAALAGADLGGGLQVAAPPHLGGPLRRLPAAAPRGKRLLTWGSLYEDKGLESVLAALAALPADHGWQLTVLGAAHQAEYRARLERAATGLPVTFAGRFERDALQRQAADYALLPSLCDESYGLVFDEAMQLGLPILASAVPAYQERAPEGCCVFYPPGDAAALAALLGDGARLAALRRPSPPAPIDADAAAAALLAAYRGVRLGAAYRPRVTAAERALALFRRAERRAWSARQQPRPPAPPDDFLAPLSFEP